MRRAAALAASFLMLAVAAGCSLTAGQPAASFALAADDGAKIVTVSSLGPRIRDLTVDSLAVGMVKVRVLLPLDYETSGDRRFPVLMLLHGGGGDYTDWDRRTNVEIYTAPAEALIVMPAAASSYMGDRTLSPDATREGSRPLWEKFHLAELLQLLQRNLRASNVQAVAGLSLGGYGSVMYTARHPGLFVATASYSGVLDVTASGISSPAVQSAIDQAEQLADDNGWPDVNPIELVSALSGATLYISYGNGEPGPLDPAGSGPDDLEAWVGAGDDNFVAALRRANLPATTDDYGAGTHSWGYWDRELKESLPLLLGKLGGG
jgi:diacylglycerol O-acyltransferase / trehalose O-mycolyltransferase / mycolyltransferase Ag85